MITGPDGSSTGGSAPAGGRPEPQREADFSDVLNNMFLDSGRRRRRNRRDEERDEKETTPVEAPAPASAAEPEPPAEPEDTEDAAAFVRPYAWTGGRTRTTFNLELETLLTTSGEGHGRQAATLEHRQVAALCVEPRSVAEVAALLSLPLGVARVLLGDMAAMGLVVVHRTAGDADGGPDLALMERVLSGLRQL